MTKKMKEFFEKNQSVNFLQSPSKYFDKQLQNNDGRKDYYILDGKNKRENQNDFVSPQRDTKGVLKIVITDTGCGMTEESLKQLFQKFSQVSNDPNKRKIGTGLGLFITKEICTKMEADIRVYSKVNKGTTFIICIPTMSISVIESQFQIQRSVASMFHMINNHGIKCLVADDSPLNVAMICNYFDKIGIKPVGTAGNGEEAVNLYKQCRQSGKMIEVVTLDIDMPKMDGKTACRKIREYERVNKLSPTIIILISGNYGEEQVEEDLGQNNNKEKKANWFLKKPVKFEEFSSTVFRLLNKMSEGLHI